MHEFFDLAQEVCDTVDQLTTLHDADFQRLRRDLLEFARRELRARGRARGVQFYDDLLVNLDEALKAPGGEILARALRERTAAAQAGPL